MYAEWPEIRDQCRRYIQQSGDLADGSVYVSTAGRLPCKHVIHSVGSLCIFEDQRTTYYDALTNSLMAADQLSLSSIALAGHTHWLFGKPVKKYMDTIVSAVKDFLEAHPLTSVRTVSLVDPRKHVVDRVRTSLSVVFGPRMVTTHYGRDDTSQEEG